MSVRGGRVLVVGVEWVELKRRHARVARHVRIGVEEIGVDIERRGGRRCGRRRRRFLRLMR